MRTLNDIWNTQLNANNIRADYNIIMQAEDEANEENVKPNEAIAIDLWVKKYCHNILSSPICYDDDVDITYLQVKVSDIICHNITLLVNEYRNMIKLADLTEGQEKTLNTANPFRNINGKPVPVKDNGNVHWNNFDIMEKQGRQMKQAHMVLRDIYKELQLMLYEII